MMNAECLKLIKDIGKYDFVIALITTIILIPLLGGGAGLFSLGIACSFINFIINSYANNIVSCIKNSFSAVLYLMFYAVRIGLVCTIAILLIMRNDLFFFAFIAGYSAQIFSLVVYGLKLKIREGV
ncbi:MAG: hypothetical protein E6344_20345 [Clostridium sp.]|nr:hypothetical protein [Clostridium sp.]MDU7086027.1 hypothetical protein [Clostridium sp.]